MAFYLDRDFRHCERSEAIQTLELLECFVASLLPMTEAAFQAPFEAALSRGGQMMILRQLSANLRAQNWTAIGIEFLIVVIGVFARPGIQLEPGAGGAAGYLAAAPSTSA